MRWIVTRMKGIMIVSGLLTCSVLYAAIAPQAALDATFGESLQGPVAEIVVRNWGVLVGLMGALLIYGAFDVAARPLVLIAAGVSKLAFVALVLAAGRQFLAGQAGVAVVVDLIQVSLFAVYLLAGEQGDSHA